MTVMANSNLWRRSIDFVRSCADSIDGCVYYFWNRFTGDLTGSLSQGYKSTHVTQLMWRHCQLDCGNGVCEPRGLR